MKPDFSGLYVLNRPASELSAASVESARVQIELIGPGGRLRMLEELRGTDHDQDNVWIFERQ